MVQPAYWHRCPWPPVPKLPAITDLLIGSYSCDDAVPRAASKHLPVRPGQQPKTRSRLLLISDAAGMFCAVLPRYVCTICANYWDGTMTPRHMLAIVNASAGAANPESVDTAGDVLGSAARESGGSFDLVRTKDLDELSAALHQLNGRNLVLLGGDGSIHSAVQCLYQDGQLQKAAPIGIIPLGTGNDLARGLRIPLDPAQAARTIIAGHARPLGLLVGNEATIAVNAVHLGVGASAASKGASIKKRLSKLRLGKLGYPLGALAAGVGRSGWALTVLVDGQVIHSASSKILLIALGLGSTVGGGANLIPSADPYDREVDVVIWESVGLLPRLAYALGLSDGSHAPRDDVRTARGRSVRVDATDGNAFYISNDGEILGPFLHREWTLEPEAWQVIVPSTDGSDR